MRCPSGSVTMAQRLPSEAYGSLTTAPKYSLRFVTTVSTDGTMVVWGNEGGLRHSKWATTQSEFGPIADAAITGDQKTVLAVYSDGSVRNWELFEPDERILTGGSSQSIRFVGKSHTIFDSHYLFDLKDNAGTRNIRAALLPGVGRSPCYHNC